MFILDELIMKITLETMKYNYVFCINNNSKYILKHSIVKYKIF